MALSVQLHLDHIELALHLVVLLSQPVYLVLLGIKLDSMAAFNVFLYLHSHDVSVYWEGHLVGH